MNSHASFVPCLETSGVGSGDGSLPLCTLETSEKSFASTSRSRENRLSRPEDTLAVEPSLRLLPIGAAAAAPAGTRSSWSANESSGTFAASLPLSLSLSSS